MDLSFPTNPSAPYLPGYGFGTLHSKNQYPSTNGVHFGIDYTVSPGNPIYAVAEGTVLKASTDGMYGYGTHVIIRHDGFDSLSAHFSQLKCTQGQAVKAGDLIGLSGNTGASGSPHLHWEVRLQYQPDGPSIYLPAQNVWCVDGEKWLLENYGAPAKYEITSLWDGLRIRIKPEVSVNSTIIGTVAKDEKRKAWEIIQIGNNKFARLCSLRLEYCAVIYNNGDYSTVQDYVPPQPKPVYTVEHDAASGYYIGRDGVPVLRLENPEDLAFAQFVRDALQQAEK
jgi:hypothetical protein